MASQTGITWDDLFLRGSVVDLHFSKWTARTRIRPADLGIADSDAVDQALALGTHRLAPREAFESINALHARIRKSVDHYSLTFGFIRGARYIPEKNLPELAEKLKGYAEEWGKIVDALVADYDKIKADMLPVLEQALRDAARTPESAAAAIERLRAEYPSADEVRQKFSLRWNVYQIQGPRKAGAQAALQDEAGQVRDVMREMIVDLRNEVRGKLADVLALIQKGGKLQERSVESAIAVLDHVDAVNVFEDQVLSAQVRALRVALKGINTEERVADVTISNLNEIKKELDVSVEAAVAAAEKKLTQTGRRKLAGVA